MRVIKIWFLCVVKIACQAFFIPTLRHGPESILISRNGLSRAHSIYLRSSSLRMGYHAGLDFGSSGVRLTVIDDEARPVHTDSYRWQKKFATIQDPRFWLDGLDALLICIPSEIARGMENICISGTSASVLVLTPESGKITRFARMYNYNVLMESPKGQEALEIISDAVDMITSESVDGAKEESSTSKPLGHTVQSTTSSLAKLVTMHLETRLKPEEMVASQADYLSAYLRRSATGEMQIITDWNNALKFGFDTAKLRYPSWLISEDNQLKDCIAAALPPVVLAPGAKAGPVGNSPARRYGFPENCQVVAGTTDSIAAFIAAGGLSEGEGTAVSSLGTTLAIKMLSANPVEDLTRGVYSHRLSDYWLVGGASNVGCGALTENGLTDSAEIEKLCQNWDPEQDLELDYYPLVGVGERFPICDPLKEAVYTPTAKTKAEFVWGVLQGIARVEKEGYDVLKSLGASELKKVLSAGGGSVNLKWMQLRQRLLGVPVSRATNGEASFGAALLARGLEKLQTSSGQLSAQLEAAEKNTGEEGSKA